ncbi:GxxExxY protein [Thiohalocapsa sp. ML1]|jgi:GxxExxY protein|uniref:GxxExxY protein n=1 Tax=Thiohalocapsa sp. ML1 TaxID=1431688 RepID=UPI0007320D40|nr:GxxExxY protein [Thiohalocapsa sp. ML1]
MEKDPLSGAVIGAAIEVHRHLGPGLLESTYEACLAYELQQRGIGFQLQVPLPVRYKGVSLECGYRIDAMVEGRLLLELKAVERILPIHAAQILTYMRLASVDTGLLINFNVTRLIDGVQRFKL